MKASAYIGRVGGLAIALGVGVAMTSGIGAAWADPHGSTTSDSSAGSTSSRTGGTTGAGPADPGPRVRIKRAEDQASRTLTGLTHELQNRVQAASGKSKHATATTPKKKKTTGRPSTESSAPRTATRPDAPRAEVAPNTATPTATDTPKPASRMKAPAPTQAAAPAGTAEPVTKPLTTTTPTTTPPHDPIRAVATAISHLFAAVNSPAVGNTPTAPADPPLSWVMLAAARRELSGSSTSAKTVAAKAQPAPTDATAWFQQAVYTPVHDGIQNWIDSDLGRQVDGAINTVAGSYVIGNGADGTAANPDGGAGGWLLGDGGDGWSSTAAGVGGGNGGTAGFLGDGGRGGDGGAGSDGGTGGTGGFLMGLGGAGGDGGDGVAGGAGGAGGEGGSATGLAFGIGGAGGDGGSGTDGGRGGDGGDGAALLGSGGDGGDAGDGGIGGASTRLAALGGAGGNGGLFGEHGTVGHYGTRADTSASGDTSLGTTGKWITDSEGRVVILHGVNMVYKVPPYEPSASGFSDDDAQFLADNGFNVVRLGINWAAVEPEPGVYDDEYLASIQQTVQTLNAHGVYVILDMHQDTYGTTFGGEGAPEWATQTGGLPNPILGFPLTQFLNPAEQHAWDAFWSNSTASDGVGLENHYAQTWQHVAYYFKDEPGVVGYEIMNEPYPGASQMLPTMFGSPFFSAQQLTPFYNQVDAAIRSADPNTTVYFEPDADTNLGFPVYLGTIDDPNSVLSYHAYDYVSLGPLGSFPNAQLISDNAQAYAAAHGIPAFMSEFGGSSDSARIIGSMDPADQHMFGWTEWSYTGVGDITTFAPPEEEALVYDPSLPPEGDNVNTANLKTLAQPYPQVTSGTPQSWSFDDGAFDYTYSTQRADGTGNFAAGSETTIATPAVQFPNGYQVTVTGGHVVSAPNTTKLVIASDEGASEVHVVVTANPDGSAVTTV